MSEHNLVLLRGVLASDAVVRELPAGGTVSQFDVTTRDDAGTSTVPVAWLDPPADGLPVEPGEGVVIIGRVSRRFFRVGGATQSRTEVVAEKVIAAARARDVGRAIGAACRRASGG